MIIRELLFFEHYKNNFQQKKKLQILESIFVIIISVFWNLNKVRALFLFLLSWKDCQFDAFLPLYINNRHGKKALPKAEKLFLKLWKRANPNMQATPELFLVTCAKIMNGTLYVFFLNCKNKVHMKNNPSGKYQSSDPCKLQAPGSKLQVLVFLDCESF